MIAASDAYLVDFLLSCFLSAIRSEVWEVGVDIEVEEEVEDDLVGKFKHGSALRHTEKGMREADSQNTQKLPY